jgi:sugar transferase (PEP-CTERM system associated)
MAACEFVLAVAAVYVAAWLRLGQETLTGTTLGISGLLYATIVVLSMTAMGVYQAYIREGYTGMMLRTAVAIFLVGSLASAIVYYLLPALALGRGTLAIAGIAAFVLIAMCRWLTLGLLDHEAMKRRVLVLGTGERAVKIASRMRRRYDQRGFRLLGYVPVGDSPHRVTEFGGEVLTLNESLAEYCAADRVQEIVVAVDERRRQRGEHGGLPLDDLLDCRMSGVLVTDVQAFIEREVGKVDIDLLQPSWILFSDGFARGSVRISSKRSFDVLASLGLLFFTWPIMALTALAISIESGFRGSVLYRQQRVGLDGRYFYVTKFRSMGLDAEPDGAVWAAPNDPRVTRVGRFIRAARIDELPQIFNVLRGDMSFVGPRPERPEFVHDLAEKIPYYDQRHRIKPGLTGWAQLCYPYGASLDDAREKLQYDLYYLKNHSVLLDLIILIQTIDVVLVGEGAR